MSRYSRLTLELPSNREDELTAALWSLDPLGMEIVNSESGSRIDAYFLGVVPARAERLLEPWALELSRHEVGEVAAEDWLAAYRSAAQPIEIGQRWWVDPREPGLEMPPDGGRELLRIPARRAFGTGSHESTRLILEWLEDLDLEGRRVLDLGSGSGILSLAAERLGAAVVVGVDVDPVACFVASDNRRLNGGSFSLMAGGLAALGQRVFDLALVNILPSQWVGAAPELAAVLKPRGAVLFSGVPLDERETFESAVAGARLQCHEARCDGEWVALRARRMT